MHKDMVSFRMRTGLSRLISIWSIHVYAPTFGHDNNEIDHFYQQLKEMIDQTQRKGILVAQADWDAKVGMQCRVK